MSTILDYDEADGGRCAINLPASFIQEDTGGDQIILRLPEETDIVEGETYEVSIQLDFVDVTTLDAIQEGCSVTLSTATYVDDFDLFGFPVERFAWAGEGSCPKTGGTLSDGSGAVVFEDFTFAGFVGTRSVE